MGIALPTVLVMGVAVTCLQMPGKMLDPAVFLTGDLQPPNKAGSSGQHLDTPGDRFRAHLGEQLVPQSP